MLIQKLHEEYVFHGTQLVFHGTRFFRVTSESTLIFYSVLVTENNFYLLYIIALENGHLKLAELLARRVSDDTNTRNLSK